MKFIKFEIVVEFPNENGQKWRRLWGKNGGNRATREEDPYKWQRPFCHENITIRS